MERVERFVEIDAPVELVFDRLSDFEGFPRWMRNIRDVRRVGRRLSHWVSETAVPDVYAEWEAELTVYEPDHRLVWRSVRGDIHADGEAIISETPEGTTLLHVVLGFDTPLGRSGAQAARFFGVHPGRQLEEDLERFRRLAEREVRGRTREAGEGRRHSFAPVMSRREAPRRDERTTRRRDYEDAPRRVEERFSREREREDRERDYEPRYALTPRERERERDAYERRYDPRVSEMFGRRGVDRLLDESPDGRRRGRE